MILPKLALAVLLAAVPSCDEKKAVTPSNLEPRGGATARLQQIDLHSSAFERGQSIPSPFTCDGPDKPPPLEWGRPPGRTHSFALLVIDPEAPSGTFGHWGVYDIPRTSRSISAGQPVGHETVNDFGKPGYGGPCPPRGAAAHHYHVQIFALDVDRLVLGKRPTISDLEQAAAQHSIGKGELVATYRRN